MMSITNEIVWLRRLFSYMGCQYFIPLRCIVTTKILFRLLTIQFFISDINTSRSIFMLHITPSRMGLLVCILFLLLYRLQMFSPILIPFHVFICFLANSRYLQLLHHEFEGRTLRNVLFYLGRTVLSSLLRIYILLIL